MSKLIGLKNYLFKMADVLKKYNVEFFLSSGTLLGAIRDKDFIKGDIDIDIGVKINYFKDNKLLAKVCADLKKVNIYPHINWNDFASTCFLNSNKIPLDIYYYNKKGKYYNIYLKDKISRFPQEFIDSLDKIIFLGREFKIPHNPEKYLEYLYGKDWRIPQVGKKGTSNKIPYKHYTLISYHSIIPLYRKQK